MLGRKQNITNEQFRECAKNAHKYITREQLNQKIEQTIKRISDFCASKNAAYAWSGGKDSLVLSELCQKAGIEQGVFCMCSLDYQCFIDWTDKYKPEGIFVYDSGYDLEWLAKNQQYLFPQGDYLFRWYQMYRWTPEKKYYKNNNLDILCFGRRNIEGNRTGKNGIATNKNGDVSFSPLYDWSHEEIFAYITYYNVTMPPVYDWEDGYVQGTHPWNEIHFGKDVNDYWRKIYNIEPEIVIDASQYFDSAKQYLDSK